jgi:hypothetical protein
MTTLLAIALISIGSWNADHTTYSIKGRECGQVVRGTAEVQRGGETFVPWYAIGPKHHNDLAFHTQEQAEAEIESECGE